jgi:hypothetical protein
MSTYTYFWKENNRIVSPFFDKEEDAMEWAKQYGKPIKLNQKT